ncbi:MAG: tail protein X [Pseudomonadota bacterium]
MANYYRTKAGDTLDWICWQYYTKKINLGSAAMNVDPRLLDSSRLLENGFLLGPQSDEDAKGRVEAVLQANPSLTAYPLALPAGLRVYLPDLDTDPQADTSTQLWD